MKKSPSYSGKYMTSLPPDLHALKKEIEGYAREYGLDFFDVIYEVLDWNQLNEVAAYGGFPNRYPHWRFGMEYEELSKSYAYGLSKIYEMVINNDPCYAYLLYSNSIVDQKLVMAHVYAHCDFFKNNVYFAHTNRKMMDEMANHKTRILRYIDDYGREKVEDFIDSCLSIDTLIDYHAPSIRRRRAPREETVPGRSVRKLRVARPYMEDYINPDEFIEAQKRWLSEQTAKEKRFPEHPERDILLFLLENAPLESWERDVLSIIREEAYYFAPQGQTKIMNEGWACTTGNTLVYCDSGLRPIKEIVENFLPARVHDGDEKQCVTDYACFPKRKTVKVVTRRGFELEGSTTHRILMADGKTWKRLDEIRKGDKVAIGCPKGLWPERYVTVDRELRHRLMMNDFAKLAGVNVSTLIRHRNGSIVHAEGSPVACASAAYDAHKAVFPACFNARKPINIPPVIDVKLGEFLGYIIGDGHISVKKRTIGFTSGDENQAIDFASLCTELFGLETKTKKDGERYRVSLSSESLREFLEEMDVKTGRCAREKCVPPAVLCSPKAVVAAFLRALFDCDGYAGPCGVILSTSSTEMSKVVQLLLLNFGILSSRRLQQHDIWNVHITGESGERFMNEIGFSLQRKQEKLRRYIEDRSWFKEENWTDEIVSIGHGEADVYDMTVENTHRYIAHGFINHNSFWHSKIMTEKALKDSELIDYADHHSGTVAMMPGRLNPYKIGYELFKDIEERWNKGKFGKEYEECDDMVAKKQWDQKLGLGRQKIFEVRRLYNDVMFIDDFLTPEFCQEHKLFVYAYDLTSEELKIASREFESIKQKLLFQLTNFGHPIINVVDANYKNRAELLLEHVHEGIDLRLDYAFETLKNLYRIWRRPVNIQTVCDGVPKVLSFDGTAASETRI
jgi:stage V sporulation protein R